ncbi:concanavalin A-like lectin/glucanase domain-containing protein [Microdochium trichocladiopsis]|uniref:Concanavalin A-like lectin/glucanase domain-containing protein n=1 Tax=Microdochium trichocladiopsis TaxID=1682393 RepID=A0A9P8XXI2_9PEZI|nr:concanavalin A-like lectin/glucanase domain-containing protein [Microdochium trichocladiopsis]KAH7025064.1 concanavalin A-like lectin/glucanase domain-containing protein [Microdochium trichocladiopsis]
MGFFVGLIVNAVLIGVPIGASLGTLFGVRPFQNERKVAPTDPERFDHILTGSICGEFHEFALNRLGNNYTINSNEILEAPGSTLCTTITKYQNGTYPTSSTTPDFSFTWDYPFKIANASAPRNQTQPLIHAFPQISIADGGVLPIRLEDLGELTLDFKWTMGTGSEPSPETSELRLGAAQVNSSVALDMYLDSTEERARNASSAKFEMIIVFAKYGLQHPVGFGNGTIVKSQTIDGHEFNLFAGQNNNKQNVFSWIATRPVTSINSDLRPLFTSIIELDDKLATQFKVDKPTFTNYLGYAGFGTQAYNSIGNVTFAVRDMQFNVRKFGTTR